MTEYYYRGVSLADANKDEFNDGRIEGYVYDIYKGRLDMDNPQSTVARGTKVEDIQWWMPEGHEGDVFLTEERGVTGGLTDVIGTAISFTGPPVPIVMYLRKDGLNGKASPVQYRYDWFDNFPGGLAWVYGETIDGEVRAMEEGLMALAVDAEGGPEVWVWGHDDLHGEGMVYTDEREVLVADDHIDIASALETVVVMLDGRWNVNNVLSVFDGYHSGYGEGRDVREMPTAEALDALHGEVRGASNMPLPDLWTINLGTQIKGKVREVPPDALEYAYDGSSMYTDASEVPGYLLGD